MAGSKSDYLENAILDHMLGGGNYSRPETVYLALFTTAPSDSGAGVEVSAENYARASITNNATNWPAASSGQKKNGTYILFPIPDSNWGTVVAVALFDSPSGGNMLFWSTISSKSVAKGTPVYFAANSITITEA